MPVATMVAEDDITRPQVAEHTDCVCFLAYVGVGGAEEDAAREIDQHGLFKAPDAIEFAK
jgi:hypothetical protein